MGTFIIYFALILIIPIWAQMHVKGTFKKYVKVSNNKGITGAETARRILDEHGLTQVKVQEVHGFLTDHYDPRKKVVRLSSRIFHDATIAGTAVAAHEVGHAIQDAKAYAPLRIRHALVPVAQIGSSLSWIFIIAGFIFGIMEAALLGIIFFAAAVLFQLVTLPVEFNASSRALTQLNTLQLIGPSDEGGVKKVLNAAALTYVAAALVAILELLRFIFIFIGMNQDD